MNVQPQSRNSFLFLYPQEGLLDILDMANHRNFRLLRIPRHKGLEHPLVRIENLDGKIAARIQDGFGIHENIFYEIEEKDQEGVLGRIGNDEMEINFLLSKVQRQAFLDRIVTLQDILLQFLQVVVRNHGGGLFRDMGFQKQPDVKKVLQGEILKREEIGDALFCLFRIHFGDEGAAQRSLADLQESEHLQGMKGLSQRTLAYPESLHQFSVRRKLVPRLQSTFDNGVLDLLNDILRNFTGLCTGEHKVSFSLNAAGWLAC